MEWGKTHRKVKTLINPRTTICLTICKWKVHGTIINRPWNGVPDALRLMIRKVKEILAVTYKDFQKDLKAAGTTVLQNRISK